MAAVPAAAVVGEHLPQQRGDAPFSRRAARSVEGRAGRSRPGALTTGGATSRRHYNSAVEIYSLSPWALAYCVVALLLAYTLRGGTGFGGALGMAMMVVVMPIKVMVPAWTLLSISSSVAILGHD